MFIVSKHLCWIKAQNTNGNQLVYVNPTNDIVDSIQIAVRCVHIHFECFLKSKLTLSLLLLRFAIRLLIATYVLYAKPFQLQFFCSQNKICFPYLRKVIDATTVFHWYFHSIFLEFKSICLELFLCLSHTAQYAYNVQNVFERIALHGSAWK